MADKNQILLKITKYLLFAVALSPLIFTQSTVFPFIFGKMIFFRVLVELALIFFLVYLLISTFKSHISAKVNNELKIKNPLGLFLGLFLLSLVVSTIFAVNPYRAFWGDIERAEGLFGMLHLFAFLAVSLTVFQKKDWLSFLKISLVAGFVNILLGFLQFFGIADVIIGIRDLSRPESLIGNPSFLASYSVVFIGLAVIVFFKNKGKHIKFWKYFSLTTAFLSLVMIFLTAARGAIVGIGAGLLFVLVYLLFSNKSRSIKLFNISFKQISGALLILLIVFSGVFWLTRNVSVWQKVPGLNRLAGTAVFDINDPSVQTRLITYKISWEAFKEKPIFGWGPDNFITAYSRHHDPSYAVYGETWLDRAHNKIFDVMVMQGAVGLLVYLGFFISLIYLIFKIPFSEDANFKENKRFLFCILLTAVLISYFVQNLFTFDDFSVYIILFSIIGFVIAFSKNEEQVKEFRPVGIAKPVFVLLSSGLGVIILFSVVYYNYIPYTQAKNIPVAQNVKSFSTQKVQNALRHTFNPYNFAQSSFRMRIANFYYSEHQDVYVDDRHAAISKTVAESLDEVIEKEPKYDPRPYILRSLIYYTQAAQKPELYKKAVEYAKKARDLAPTRQEPYYHLALALAGQGKYDEAIKTAQKAVDFDPRVSRAHFHLALVYSAAGRKDRALEEMKIAEDINPTFAGYYIADFNNILYMYQAFGKLDKMADLVWKHYANKITQTLKLNKKYVELALYYYITQHNAERVVGLASFLYQERPGDMEIIADLAKKGKWEVLENSLQLQL